MKLVNSGKGFLKLQPETAEDAKLLNIGKILAGRQYMPDKIDPEKAEDIINAGSDFHIGSAVQ
jgi:hypothetical protein